MGDVSTSRDLTPVRLILRAGGTSGGWRYLLHHDRDTKYIDFVANVTRLSYVGNG